MTKVLLTESYLENIADAIRAKNGTQDTYTPGEMSEAIDNIPSVGNYFNTNPETMSSPSNSWMNNNFIKNDEINNTIAGLTVTIPSSVTSLTGLFYGWTRPVCPKIICGNNVTRMAEMYASFSQGTYTNFTSVDLSGLDTSNVTNVYRMFYNCRYLTSIDMSNLDMSSLNLGAGNMCEGCTSLRTADISCFHMKPTGNVGFDCASMFKDCTSLTNINFANDYVDTSNIIVLPTTNVNITGMFENCSSLTTLDLSGFILPNLKNCGRLFNGCTSLAHIDIRNFGFSNISNYTNMFGADATTGVPDNCLIIVKDNTVKDWINTNFSRLTNVQTVAEYEASQAGE